MSEWAGNKARQVEITRQILKRYRGEHPVDMAGVAETILVNLINDASTSYGVALQGLDACVADMRATLRELRGIQ